MLNLPSFTHPLAYHPGHNFAGHGYIAGNHLILGGGLGMCVGYLNSYSSEEGGPRTQEFSPMTAAGS